MRPTAFGAKTMGFLALLVVAFYVSPYSNLFFLQLAFLCVLLATSALACARNLRGVTGRAFAPRPFAAGAADTELATELVGPQRGARAVRLELRLKDGTRAALLEPVDLVAGGRAHVTGRLPGLPRGIHAIASLRAQSSHPLGLFVATRALDAPAELVVFPAPVELPGLRRGGGLRGAAAALGDGPLVPGDDVVSSLREWREGDAPRDVHWRATARRGKRIVKERDGDAGAGLVVVFDRRGDAAGIEQALGELSALALAARERAEPLELLSQDHHRRYGEGGAPLDELLHWLAATAALPTNAAAPPHAPAGALRLPRRARPTPVRAGAVEVNP